MSDQLLGGFLVILGGVALWGGLIVGDAVARIVRRWRKL